MEYNKKKANITKNIYKTFVTTIVKALFKHTEYMGSYTEYRDYYVYGKDKSLEIMVHPTLHNNKMVDTIFEKGQREYIDFEKILRHV